MILKAINIKNKYNLHLEFIGTQICVKFNFGSFPYYRRANLTYYTMESFLSNWDPISIHHISPFEESNYKLQINHIYSHIRDNKLKSVLS